MKFKWFFAFAASLAVLITVGYFAAIFWGLMILERAVQ